MLIFWSESRGRLEGQKHLYTIWGLNLIVSSENVFLVLFCSRRTVYIVRDNEKKFTSVGLSYKGVMLLPKIFYVFYVV